MQGLSYLLRLSLQLAGSSRQFAVSPCWGRPWLPMSSCGRLGSSPACLPARGQRTSHWCHPRISSLALGCSPQSLAALHPAVGAWPCFLGTGIQIPQRHALALFDLERFAVLEESAILCVYLLSWEQPWLSSFSPESSSSWRCYCTV